jgi:hypothetical protein
MHPKKGLARGLQSDEAYGRHKTTTKYHHTMHATILSLLPLAGA